MKKKLLLLLLSGLMIVGCSRDEMPDEGNGIPDFLTNVSVIGFRDFEVYRLDLNSDASSVTATNLTTTLGVPIDFDRLTIRNSLVTFFQVTIQSYRVFQQDLNTGDSFTTDQFCLQDPGEVRIFPQNSNEKLLSFVLRPNNCAPLLNSVRVFDKVSGACNNIPLQNQTICTSNIRAFVQGEKVYLSQPVDADTFQIYSLDLQTGFQGPSLEVAAGFKATVVDDTLYVFVNDTLSIYSPSDMQLIDSYAFDSALGGQTGGWFESQVNGNAMLVEYLYPQPSLIASGPAIIDLDSGQFLEGDDDFLFRMRERLGSELGIDVFFRGYKVDPETQLIVLAYQTGGAEQGGLVQTNFDGDILAYAEFDYVPGTGAIIFR